MAFGALNVECQCSWAVVQSYTAVADMPIVVLKTLLKPVETPQVQFLDKVFLQFIDQVVDISVVAQRPFPMVPVFPRRPLRYTSCNTLIRWSMSLSCRSCRYAHCRKPVKLPQVQYLDMVVGTRPCDHATTSSCSLLYSGTCHRFSSSPRMVKIPVRNRDRYAQCKTVHGDMAVGRVAAMRGIFCLIFEAFFALRPAGRRVPGGGDAGSLTPRCSATLIRCTRAAISTETSLLHHVRTTTTTTTTTTNNQQQQQFQN